MVDSENPFNRGIFRNLPYSNDIKLCKIAFIKYSMRLLLQIRLNKHSNVNTVGLYYLFVLTSTT